MTYRPLVPCKGCARHVLAGEAACPFCGAALQAPGALRRADLPRRPTRAMLFTFGAALSTMACGSTVVGNEGDSGGADVRVTTDTGNTTDRVTPTDNGPSDTGVFPSDRAMGDDVTVAPPYGVPPKDAGPDDDGGVMAEYGAPPQDAGTPDDDGGTNADYGAPPDIDAGGGGFMPLYGSPPIPEEDSGLHADAGAPARRDAGTGGITPVDGATPAPDAAGGGGGGGGIMPLYGSPPVPDDYWV